MREGFPVPPFAVSLSRNRALCLAQCFLQENAVKVKVWTRPEVKEIQFAQVWANAQRRERRGLIGWIRSFALPVQ
jgi:hypothetical protein